MKWSENSKYINAQLFSYDIWINAVINDVTNDVGLLLTAIVLIVTYCILVLGSCSPVHFRFVTSLFGLFCVLLSTMAGYGISFYAGYLISRMHGFLPFMILGLGVDDMFVIVNSID